MRWYELKWDESISSRKVHDAQQKLYIIWRNQAAHKETKHAENKVRRDRERGKKPTKPK